MTLHTPEFRTLTISDTNTADRIIRMGDVYRIAFPAYGEESSSVQGGIRPAIIVSNDQNNKHSSTVQVIPITTSRIKKTRAYPMHVLIPADGKLLESVAMVEQLSTISKTWIVSERISTVSPEILIKLGAAFRIQFPISQFA